MPAADPATPNCPGRPALLAVEAVDPDGTVTSVVAVWSADGTQTTSTPLDAIGGGPLYRAQVGPWTATGPQQIVVEATDDAGATAEAIVSVTVTACP